jgi:cobalamin biosynthesis protein CobD/CbiB
VNGRTDYRVIGGGLAVLIIVAIGLWNEFHEAGQTVWNVFLAVIVVGLIVAAIFGQRYFRAHVGEIGEARFDTRNQDEK